MKYEHITDPATRNVTYRRGLDLSLSVHVTAGRTTTLAEITLPPGSQVKAAVGEAKRDAAHDCDNPAIGRRLAIGRALMAAGAVLLQEADAMIGQPPSPPPDPRAGALVEKDFFAWSGE